MTKEGAPADDDDEPWRCWCGTVGTYLELCDEDGLPPNCGGLGWLHCECGGDSLCCCHHHGGIECPGCLECRHESEFGDYDPEDYL